MVAHGEGNIFCEKPSGFDKLIKINVKFHFKYDYAYLLWQADTLRWGNKKSENDASCKQCFQAH
jgi:hypothetical protein